MSFDRWIRTGSITSTNLPTQPHFGLDNPRISLGLEKDLPEITNKIFDRLLNYHVCAENQVNELLQQFEYNKVLEKSEKSLNEVDKHVEQSTQKIVQSIATFDEINPEIQKTISVSLAYAQDWMNKKTKSQQPQKPSYPIHSQSSLPPTVNTTTQQSTTTPTTSSSSTTTPVQQTTPSNEDQSTTTASSDNN
ncbi:hypothetical protein NAEGRDRAFT_58708 [Naegleria gruberi]|uniref:Uncharacterized protein n=1 Tax=Naegleria gruberi TaxID=5762 RepID=D2VMU4_NAEGR|nr:uncharacterized protein NAEGRDRAFT_58708 [Naegleria gruberi]EFC41801.1 hypothetical protein NAEGRDRAFT_58708 [Naegleria gruberi]|eukprot:XP_002674545.1 hypothetical protein NAEGRDRAFT_58708 [Naegleria gruberi strain NEG-M]